METKHNNGVQVQNGTAKDLIKTSTNGEAKKPGASKTDATIPQNPLKDEKPNGIQPGQQDQLKPEQQSAPIKEEIPIRPVLTLEIKLKAVDDLHRKSIQRLNLIKRKGELEAFEVKLESEQDELNDNPFQGCKLIIEDDKRRQFITTTPGLIRLVSQFIFNACDEKLREIEASIVFPGS